MVIGISRKSYEHKPTESEIGHMNFRNRELSIDEFGALINEGYSYTSVMNGKRNRDNFSCSFILTFDIDNSTTEMSECLERLDIKPTLAYTSSSNGLEGYGYRYRLVYCFSQPITTFEDYYVMSKSLEVQLGLTDVDSKSPYPEQYWNGSKDCSLVINNIVYEKGIIDIKDEYKREFKKKYINKKGNAQKSATQSYKITPKHIGLTCTFENDFWMLSFKEILDKYHFPNIEHTPIEFDDTMPMVRYPDRYYEISRPCYMTKGGRTRKIRDGEGRRRKLYLNGLVRRKINPDITFDNLLHNLVYEFYHYYVNDGNKIRKGTLYLIAQNVMEAEIRDGDLGKPKSKYFVNPLYCLKHGLTKKQVLGQLKNKKQYIGEFYDFTKTDKENIDIMAEYGLEISLRTLKTWKKENGIVHNKKRK